jgi:hypothetical protein
MPRMIHPPAPTLMDAPPEHIAMPPPTIARVPRRWKLATLLHFLPILATSGTRRHSGESPWLSSDPTRWETLTEMLARKHPHRYIDFRQS